MGLLHVYPLKLDLKSFEESHFLEEILMYSLLIQVSICKWFLVLDMVGTCLELEHHISYIRVNYNMANLKLMVELLMSLCKMTNIPSNSFTCC